MGRYTLWLAALLAVAACRPIARPEVANSPSAGEVRSPDTASSAPAALAAPATATSAAANAQVLPLSEPQVDPTRAAALATLQPDVQRWHRECQNQEVATDACTTLAERIGKAIGSDTVLRAHVAGSLEARWWLEQINVAGLSAGAPLPASLRLGKMMVADSDQDTATVVAWAGWWQSDLLRRAQLPGADLALLAQKSSLLAVWASECSGLCVCQPPPWLERADLACAAPWVAFAQTVTQADFADQRALVWRLRRAGLLSRDPAVRYQAVADVVHAQAEKDDDCRAQWAAHDVALDLATPASVAKAFLHLENLQPPAVVAPCEVDGRKTPDYDFAVADAAGEPTPVLDDDDRASRLETVRAPKAPPALRKALTSWKKRVRALERACPQMYTDGDDGDNPSSPTEECLAKARTMLDELRPQPQLAAFVYLDLLADATAPNFLDDDLFVDFFTGELSGMAVFAGGLRHIADPAVMVQGLVAHLQRQAAAGDGEWEIAESPGHLQRLGWFTWQHLCGPGPQDTDHGQPCVAAWVRWYLGHRQQTPEQWYREGRQATVKALQCSDATERYFAAQILLRSREPGDPVRARWAIRDLLLTAGRDKDQLFYDTRELVKDMPLRTVLFPPPIDGRKAVNLAVPGGAR